MPNQIKFGQARPQLELGGSGVVNPQVLAIMNGLDPDVYRVCVRGGIDRMGMLKYGVPDIRSFFESDLRWLRHYGFAALDMPSLDGGLSR